jgi:beta-1,4-N-acetylglucosaminyltransferase
VTTFVSVGNATQSFSRLIDAVVKIAPRLPQPVVMQHGNTALKGTECIAQPFMDMEKFGCLMSQSQLLILHAGAGSVIHALQAGKVPVVMPRRAKYGEIVDDHQLEFAQTLAAAGKIVLAEEAQDLTEAVAEALRRQQVTSVSFDTPCIVGIIDAILQKHSEKLDR